MKQRFRLGVDAGGTFTDFVLAEHNGPLRLFKSPSTPEDGTKAIAAGLQQMAEALDMPVGDIIKNCDLCINGTTVALNALIERTGVKVGLLCTEGHEDSLEIRLGHGRSTEGGQVQLHLVGAEVSDQPEPGAVFGEPGPPVLARMRVGHIQFVKGAQ